MTELYLDWLKGAEETLGVVDLLFKHEKYRFAIFHLQQAAEITSKAVLMRISLLKTVEENALAKEIREDMHLSAKSAKYYSHDWHYKLLDVMDGFIGKFDKLSEFIISNKLADKKTAPQILEFRDSVPDYKLRIKNAHKLQANVNPSIDELNEVILFCLGKLELTSKAVEKVKTKMDKFKMPDKKRLVREAEKAYGTKLDSDGRKVVDRLWVLNFSDYAQRMVVFSQTLIILAIVNSYLLPHESISRYPFGQTDITYNPYTPIVRKTKDFSVVTQLCIWRGQGKQGFYHKNDNLLGFKGES